MSRVLITGASGFVGRQCLARLDVPGEDVHAVVRHGPGPAMPRVTSHRADLLSAAEVSALLAEVRPSHLLHLAWITTPGAYWTSPENLAWLGASLHLLRAFAENGGARAVLAGSCAEYDWTAGECREGQTPLRPASLYGICKDALREVAEGLGRHAGLSVAWARLFFLYGPHEAPRRLVPAVTRALLRGEPALCSPGEQERDFLHVEDAAAALVALLHGRVTGAVNVGSGEAVPVQAVARRLAALVGRPELLRLGALPPTGEAPRVVADVRRLREEVGWAPRFDLERGLAQTVAWWAAQGRSRLAA
jgi:nucleoside-diphosphate-sugar epimerase